MIAAYEGNLPFIFVSYAHKDSREVFDLIEKLAARGYRIWYDEGIEPGSEWPENIANHLLRAEMVLAMITNDSMESVNCRREINYAMSKGKPLLSVVLEKTEIPAGMELQLSSQQSVLRYNFTDEVRFLDKIESCSYMDPCKINPATDIPDESNAQNAEPTATKKKKPDIRIAAGLGIVLAALLIFFAVSQNKSTKEPPEQTVPAVTSTDSSEVSPDSNTASPDSSAATITDTSSGTVSEPDSTVETPAETTPDPRWIYSVSTDEENLTYTFRSGPVIVMPISWKNKITVMEEDKNFVFYHEGSRNAWQIHEGSHGGKLFSLCYSKTQDYKVLPSYSELGRNAEEYYYLMYPTDVQGYMDNERIYDEYNQMWQELNYVERHSSFSMN
ncbi:MAG: TIR domain-containing protein [Lachnospiraceae bacterium]|nr:TIR domain-containing protein [Lachnospiraceae bacterium]